MNRRDTGIALFALWAVSHRGWAQPASKVFRIGVLSQYFPRERFTLAAALREFGYEEGRNFVFDFRYADGRDDRLASLAAGLVESKVDLIVAVTNAETFAAKRATSAIPIIMWNAVAPVEAGLVASLARPGGNVTGTTVQVPEHAGKLLEVLRDAVPRAARVAVLWDPSFPGIEVYRREAERAAALMGIRLTLLPGRSLLEIDAAFDAISRDHPDALYVVNTGAIFTHRGRVIEMAAHQRVPAMYVTKLLAAEGGLMSYSPDGGALINRTAAIIDRVLKGANPAEVPVEQPTKYELVLNLKTAKALGFTFPLSVRLRADEVIE